VHVSVGRRSVCHLSPGNGPSNARAILAVFCRRGWQLSLPSLVAGAILNRRLMGIYGWEQRLRLAPISACAIPTVLHLSCTICLFWLLPTLNSFEEHLSTKRIRRWCRQTDRQLARPTPTPTLKHQKVQHERRPRKQQRRRYVAIHGRLHQLCRKLYDSRQTSLKKFFRDVSRIYSPAVKWL